jgi:hypothetical protein
MQPTRLTEVGVKDPTLPQAKKRFDEPESRNAERR